MPVAIPGMSPAQARAWFALVSVAQLLPTTLDQQLSEDAGVINYEYGVLGALNFSPERTLRMSDLAAAMHSPMPRLSKAVSRLEGRGLVERQAGPSDGRAINVHLTGDGRRTWAKASRPHIVLARDTILGDLTDEQLGALSDLLEPILGRLDRDGQFGRLPGAERC